MKTVTGLGGCDCGGKVVVVDVEAVPPRGVLDRRVLTADVDAGLGLKTCVRNGASPKAQTVQRHGEVALVVGLIPVGRYRIVRDPRQTLRSLRVRPTRRGSLRGCQAQSWVQGKPSLREMCISRLSSESGIHVQWSPVTVFGVQVWTLRCSGRLDVAHKSPSTLRHGVRLVLHISDSALLNFSFAFALLFVCSIRTTATKTKLRCSKYTLSKNVFFYFLLLLLLKRVLHIDVGLSRLYLLVSRAGLLHSLCCLKFCDPGSVRGRLHSEVAGEVPISSSSSAGSTFPGHLSIRWSFVSRFSLVLALSVIACRSRDSSSPAICSAVMSVQIQGFSRSRI